MRRDLLVPGLVLACVLCLGAAIAQEIKVENGTLEKAVDALTADVKDMAVSATFVRTFYIPQVLEESQNSEPPTIERTTISEVVVNTNGIKETLFDARKIDSLVKRHAKYYSNDGTNTKSYDAKANRGVTRRTPRTDVYHLARLLDPDAAARQSRTLSHIKPGLLDRLDGATVTSETPGSSDQGRTVTLEGEYQDSDPARYFRMTVLPQSGYAIQHLQEYDPEKRILKDVSASDFVRMGMGSTAVWLPKQRTAKTYTYDDQEGNSTQVAHLDILKPRAVSVDDTTFALRFPEDAEVYDAVLGASTSRPQDSVDTSGLAELIENPAVPILTEAKGKDIVARTELAYEEENVAAGQKTATRALRLPTSSVESAVPWILLGSVAVVIFLIVVLRRRRKARRRTETKTT